MTGNEAEGPATKSAENRAKDAEYAQLTKYVIGGLVAGLFVGTVVGAFVPSLGVGFGLSIGMAAGIAVGALVWFMRRSS